ncbi:MAG: spore photoproduct lyase [Firmicutes bacterium HGW-Firmicutes-12]|nr:MAG: spore photoproduct lyase [Firmicutes bacterium HGW-Firmicutes-12]
MPFQPKRVFFEKDALKYPLGEELWERFRKEGILVSLIASHNRVTGIPGKTPQQSYMEAKQTFVVGVRRTMKFETCKPSAHYQLPLCTSCIGKCEYCYLNTTLGNKPYLRVYVNIEEILQKTKEYIKERSPETTFFEGAATSDPLPYEAYTGALASTIEFFSTQELGYFRFVTKFTEVDSLLRLQHNGHTRIRFSLNTQYVINNYEHATPPDQERIEAAGKTARAGYPLGFLIAPVILYDKWQEDYGALIKKIADTLPQEAKKDLSFEIISYRFTSRAKERILQVFPQTTLPMEEKERKFKYGQFGYGKYIYPKEQMLEVKEFFSKKVIDSFPEANINYII